MLTESENLLKVKGRIFDIQRYSIHDGPGIRTIVFFKGCQLRCKWCSNPESQNCAVERMTLDGKTKTVGRDVTVEEVLEEVIRDSTYYRYSGGGLTLSGGEALIQHDFAEALLMTAKYNGIHTTIESTANINLAIIKKKILPFLDVFLMDIKHMDSEKHRLYTGQPNEQILDNAKAIAATGQKLIIRVPVIPTFNATVEEISAIASFAASLPGVEELHLLPYHPYGMDKYAGLGRAYEMKDIKTPDAAHMEQLKTAAEAYGIRVAIGG